MCSNAQTTQQLKKWKNLTTFYRWTTYILEQTSPELLENIEFDGESDSLRMRCQSEQDMFSLAALLQPVILDESRLSEYLEALPEQYKFG